MLRFGTWVVVLGLLGSVVGVGRLARGQMSLSITKGKAAPVVTGLPFSAEQSVSTVQEMNGVRMTHASKGRLSRSGTGQERVEMTPVASDPTAPEPGTVVYLLDPVEHTATFWSTKTKIAIMQRLPADAAVTLRAMPGAQPQGAAAARQAAVLENVTTTDLGQETREKLRLVGKRVTGTIPAGKIGNETAIVVAHDLWMSPELKVVVREVDEDPRSGDRVMELTHIVRAEPDAALFEVPAGYTVKEQNLGGPVLALGHMANEVPAEWVPRISDAHKATDPDVKNDLAYQLAMDKIALPEAHSLAEEAVGQAEREAAELSLKDADGLGFAQMERLSHYWVTLGLVYFREGQLDKAEAYMRASWELDPRGHVANHLGRVYEAEHRDADAIAVYRQALGARGSEELKQNVRERLEKVAGTAVPEPLPVDATVSVAMTPVAGSAVFDILSSHAGTQEVVLVAGDARFKSAAEAIRAALRTGLPDGGPERVLRRGRLSCAGAGGCQLQLLSPHEARAVVSGAEGE